MALADALTTITDNINKIATDFINRFDTGLMAIITWAFAKLVKWLLLAKIKFMIFAIGFGWVVAKNLLADIGIFPALDFAFSLLPVGVKGILQLVGFVDALNIIINALVTRFIMRFIPGLS